MKFVLSLVAVVFAILSIPAFAGEITTAEETFSAPLTKEDFCVSLVMTANGCGLDWLADVMEHSGISPFKLRHLPVGKAIVMPKACTTGQPAELRIAESSRLAFATDAAHAAPTVHAANSPQPESSRFSARTEPERAAEKPIPAARHMRDRESVRAAEMAQKEKELDEARLALIEANSKADANAKAFAATKMARDTLEKELMKKEIALGEAEVALNNYKVSHQFKRTLLALAFLGVALGACLGGFMLGRRSLKAVQEPVPQAEDPDKFKDCVILPGPREKKIVSSGREYTFTLNPELPAQLADSGWQMYYMCSACPEKRVLPKNFEAHLRNCPGALGLRPSTVTAKPKQPLPDNVTEIGTERKAL